MEKDAGERLRLFTFRIFRLSVDSLPEQHSHADKPRCELHRQIVQSVGGEQKRNAQTDAAVLHVAVHKVKEA